MKILFYDTETKSSREYHTASKELTPSGVARILVANVSTLIPTAALAIVEKGKWTGKISWESPSGQYLVDIMDEN